MELTKTKYKQTEVGLIPDDWEIFSYGDILKVIGGGTFKSKDRVTDGAKWLKIANVGIRQIKWDELDYLPNTYLQEYNTFLLKENDVVMALTRPILGRNLKISKLSSEDVPCLLNQRVGKIETLNESNLDWLFHLLQTNKSINALLDSMAGSDPPNLSNKGIYGIRIAVPPTLEEQKAIANALSDVDELISNLDQLITKKKAIKQGAMQQLLTPPHKGGKRLAGFTGEWVERKLGDIGEITGAGIDKKIIEGEKTVRLFNYMDVMKRDYVYNYELNHEVTAPYSKIITCNVIEGDIFLTPSSELRTDIGVSAIAIEDMQGVVYSYHLYRLRYNIEINKYYGLYLLKTKQFLDQAEKMCEGSGKRYVVSMGKFRNMIVYLPKDVKEQEAIANILYDMDKEIEQLDGKKAKYQDIKQGMMQELLTGKTRLV